MEDFVLARPNYPRVDERVKCPHCGGALRLHYSENTVFNHYTGDTVVVDIQYSYECQPCEMMTGLYSSTADALKALKERI